LIDAARAGGGLSAQDENFLLLLKARMTPDADLGLTKG
jgi:hypothetical protein